MQDTWMTRLSEYLDEELERSERETLEAHLKSCSDCALALSELRSVRERARSLEDSPAPAALWHRIEATIGASHPRPAAVTQLHAERGSRGTRFSFSLPELIAASVAIAILSGGAVFALVSHRPGATPARGPAVAQAPESSAPVRTQMAEPLEATPAPAPAAVIAEAPPARHRASQGSPNSAHEVAISDLRKALAKHRDRLDPATIRTLESNLAIIDLAIDQAERALAADPANTYVKEHLAETMRRKVELLQRATLLASTSSSEESR